MIAGDYQVSFPDNGALQNPIVRFVIRNDLQGNFRSDNLGDFGKQLQAANGSRVIPAKFQPEHPGDFSHDGGGNQKRVATVHGLSPNLKRLPLWMRKGGNVNVTVKDNSKLFGLCGIHG
jgi:hypothetical protein